MHSHLKGIVMLPVTLGLVQLLQKLLADNTKKQWCFILIHLA